MARKEKQTQFFCVHFIKKIIEIAKTIKMRKKIIHEIPNGEQIDVYCSNRPLSF